MRPDRTQETRAGFTLLELMVVFAVIALIIAVAAPNLLPLAAHFGHEGAARELASFGESAIQYAKLNNEEIIVVFDFDTGEYWVEHWVDQNAEEGDPSPDTAEFQDAMMMTMRDSGANDEERAEGRGEMTQRFDDFAGQRLYAQAMLVEHHREAAENEEFSLFGAQDERGRQWVREELAVALLKRRKLPEDVFLNSVTLPEGQTASGQADLVISPLGIERDIWIEVRSADGDLLRVRWDPILSRGFVFAEGDGE